MKNCKTEGGLPLFVWVGLISIFGLAAAWVFSR
jgi:hypothetical protein